MMRLVVLMMLCAVSAQAQTIGVFPAGTRDPNTAVPLAAFAVQPTCPVNKVPDTVNPTDRPTTMSWDAPSNPSSDCLANLAATPIASLPPLQPNGYQAALKIGTKYGPLSHAFLAPAQVTPPTIIALQSFRVRAPHTCQGATAYRLYVDDVQAGPDLPPSACASGTVTATSAGVSAGSHTVAISAVDLVSEKKGPSLPIQANPPQTTAPGLPTVVQP